MLQLHVHDGSIYLCSFLPLPNGRDINLWTGSTSPDDGGDWRGRRASRLAPNCHSVTVGGADADQGA